MKFVAGAPSSVKYSATLGQVIPVKGEKFAPNATYISRWNNWKCQGEVTTNPRGEFQGQIRLPSVIPGKYLGGGRIYTVDKATKTVLCRTSFTIGG